MYLHKVPVKTNVWYRTDTASGSNTPTSVYATDSTALPLGTEVGASGSTLRSKDPVTPLLVFYASQATIYLKALGYDYTPSGTVVTSTGLDTTPVQPSGSSGSDLATVIAGLPVTFARIGAVDFPTPWVFAGDSITTTTGYLAYAGAAALGAFPNGAITIGGTSTVDAGVGGNTSAQLLARYDADVIAKAPKVVHILIGTNDASAGATVATVAANIRAMVAKNEAIGARTILGTVPPNGTGSPSNRKALIVAYNQWIARYAMSKGIAVADYYRALVDTATGGYQSAYDSGDATHPSPAGTAAMAAELRAAVLRNRNGADLLLTKDANDPNNWVRNALFLSAFGTGWSTPSGTGITASTVSGDTAIQGNWGKIAASSSVATVASSQNQSTSQAGSAYVVGNRFFFGARIQASALSSGQSWDARLRHVNVGASDQSTKAQKIAYTGNGGLVFAQEGIAPATATQAQGLFEITSGTGDVQAAQFTIYDLVGMGVTDASGTLV